MTICEVSPSIDSLTYEYEITANVDVSTTSGISDSLGNRIPDSPNAYTLSYFVVDETGADNTDTAKFYVDNTPPTAPPVITSITATALPTVTLTFTAASDLTGIQRYEITRTPSPANPRATIDAVVGQNPYVYANDPTSPSTTYTYFVRAFDFGGHSLDSASVSVTTPNVVCPPTPQVAPQFPGGTTFSATKTARKTLTIRWTSAATDINCNFRVADSPPAGYYISRATMGAGTSVTNCPTATYTKDFFSGTLPTVVPSASQYVDVTGLSNTKFCYRITPNDGTNLSGTPGYAFGST